MWGGKKILKMLNHYFNITQKKLLFDLKINYFLNYYLDVRSLPVIQFINSRNKNAEQ